MHAVSATSEHSSSDKSRGLKAADYSSQEYWQQRFSRESSFEWLQPSERILPVIEAEVRSRRSGSVTLLHIGSGSSDLSNHLRRLLQQDAAGSTLDDRPSILNVDFSPLAIELGRRREHEEFGNSIHNGMQWAVVDLLDGQLFKRTCEDHYGTAFDIVVEKSCTDALACGPDIEVPRSFFEDLLEKSKSLVSEQMQRLLPASVLAMHLAAVTQPDAAWIALSYSGERFNFLRDDENPAAQKWSIERVQKFPLENHEGSVTGVVHRPLVYHYLYTLRRSAF